MTRILIIYFSRTGYTRRIAEALAESCHADLEAIEERRGRRGLLGFLKSGMEAFRKTPVEIAPARHDPANYDLLVIGTPVWAGHLSSPVLSYLAEHKSAVKRYAAFCTEGSESGEKVLAQIADVLGRRAEAGMVLTDKEIDIGGHKAKLNDFTGRLQRFARGDRDAAQ